MPICDITHFTDQQAREFLLIRGKGCVVQVRCTGVSLLGLEPVRMKLTISNLDAYERKLRAQKAALALVDEGPDLEAPLWTKTTQILRDCAFRGIRPPIPTASGHLNRSIRPPVARCVEA